MTGEKQQQHPVAQRLAEAPAFSKNPRRQYHHSLDGTPSCRRRTSSAVNASNVALWASLVSMHDEPKQPTSASSVDSVASYESGTTSPLSALLNMGAAAAATRRGSWLSLASNNSDQDEVALAYTPDSHRRSSFSRRRTALLSVAAACLLATWYLLSQGRAELQVLQAEEAQCTNPYASFGKLHVDPLVPENNRWEPHDPDCQPPPLMATLRGLRRDKSTYAGVKPLEWPLKSKGMLDKHAVQTLPWLAHKTVVLFGDHIERLHAKDFCKFANGEFAVIDQDHPASPPPFKNGIDEKFKHTHSDSEAPEAHSDSRPSVCYVREFDLMIVSVFHYGLATRVEYEHESLLREPHYHAPVALEDRLENIVIPLLSNLGRGKPDLVEFSSAYWELRHFEALDKQRGRDAFSELSSERMQWYATRLRDALELVIGAFPESQLLWRALHQTPKSESTPYARVAALDHLSRNVVEDVNLRRSRGATLSAADKLSSRALLAVSWQDKPAAHPTFHDTLRARPSTRTAFLNRVKGRMGLPLVPNELEHIPRQQHKDIRIDEWGALMFGQQHLLNDIHTPPLPGGFLWSDVLLWELRELSRASSPSSL